jgi:hypothetical protein
MAYTVWGAFNQFRQDTIDLDSTQTSVARTSRDHLFTQLERLARNNPAFPKLQGSFIPFGSFARRAKTRPLNDIDLLILLRGDGLEVQHSVSSTYTYQLQVTSLSAFLARFADSNGYVNSIKVLNSIKSHLASISSYQKAELKRSMQAVVLNLKSYCWVYDIVPAVPVTDYTGKVVYYLIPDGRGAWMRTDPRIDSKNITDVSVRHNGKFLPTMRLLKYWNGRFHKPRLASYYFETLTIKVFQNTATIQDYPKAVQHFFNVCPIYLRSSCPDPKRLGADLDAGVSWETKAKVIKAMEEAHSLAMFASIHEGQSKHKQAITYWQKALGSEFPSYG